MLGLRVLACNHEGYATKQSRNNYFINYLGNAVEASRSAHLDAGWFDHSRATVECPTAGSFSRGALTIDSDR